MSMQPLPVPKAWKDPIEDWKKHQIAAGFSMATVKLRMNTIRRIARAMGGGPKCAKRKKFIEFSAANPDWSKDTRRLYHQVAKLFFLFLAEEHGYKGDMVKLDVPRGNGPRPRPASPKIIIEAREEADDERARLIIRLASELGLRRGEIARIHTRDLIGGEYIKIHGKGNKDRILPLSEELYKLIAATGAGFLFPGQDHGHLSPAYVSKLASQHLPKGVRLHDLRHSFATRAYTNGADLLSVQKFLGHTNPATTLRYILLPADTLKNTMELGNKELAC